MTSVSIDVFPPISQNQTIAFATIRPTVMIGNVRVGTLSRSGSTRGFLPDHERHKRLLGVETVLRLVPDRGLRAIQHVLGDLLAVVRREAVEDDRVVARPRDEIRVDAIP